MSKVGYAGEFQDDGKLTIDKMKWILDNLPAGTSGDLPIYLEQVDAFDFQILEKHQYITSDPSGEGIKAKFLRAVEPSIKDGKFCILVYHNQ